MADDDQKAVVMATAESCMAELNDTAAAVTASSSALYTAVLTYVPEASGLPWAARLTPARPSTTPHPSCSRPAI
jgi:hypothetical protein